MRNGWRATDVLHEISTMECHSELLDLRHNRGGLFLSQRNNRIVKILPLSSPSPMEAGPFLLSSSGCDQALVKNNLRAFYFVEKLTAKIITRTNDGSGFSAETRNRGVLDGFWNLSAPEILECGPSQKWFIERLETGRTPVAADLENVAVMEEIWEMYRNGSSIETATYCCNADSLPEREIDDFVTKRMHGKSYPYIRGFVHGDLSAGNMLVSKDGKISILDWEFSGQGDIAGDLVPLCRLCPVLRTFIDRKIRARLKSVDAPKMPMQFYQTLVYLKRLNRLPEMKDYFRRRDGHEREFDANLRTLVSDLTKNIRALSLQNDWG